MKDEIIPYAIKWFTGEAQAEDSDEEEDDESEGLDEEADDEVMHCAATLAWCNLRSADLDLVNSSSECTIGNI